MAAGTITVVSLVDEAKLRLQQVGGDLLTDTQYKDYIYRNLNAESTWTLTKRQSGVFTYALAGVDPLCLWFGSTPCTLIDNCAYRLNALGPTMEITTGATVDTRSSITVTGCEVDFDCVMLDALMMIRTRQAKNRSMQIGTGSVDYDFTFDRIDKMIQDIRGAQAIG